MGVDGTAVYVLHYISGTRLMGVDGTAVYVLHYIGGTRVMGWNSCIRAALYRWDQGDGVMEQLYTCCII